MWRNTFYRWIRKPADDFREFLLMFVSNSKLLEPTPQKQFDNFFDAFFTSVAYSIVASEKYPVLPKGLLQ